MQSPIYGQTASRFSFAARPSAAAFYPVSNGTESLSDREIEVLRHVAEGLSNKEVARELDLQEKTVKHYMTSILQKLQARNRVELHLQDRVRVLLGDRFDLNATLG